ncbi:nicotinamide riboside kinase 1-like isoform X3 [Limulus polyphemus]|nr:nicotinamide riboside kinase 1-like isoform X3 [Limulus polyphemus]XP_022243661.1 nicotinamide riboside kinase 1-like isoform X3 [Limulus polyphemus]XP_022243662.1 nicotinamide riboside kinase 1-like isoform X3 [Limulus polyphemus]XP_022243663.1 nicotinamide riboside kinase 1-like isoform X3 [Limulus polyphemus]XP_022243664.1 nicotinamide riboside kinase 1-like isoform X3 [Limulus polyphemus]
MLQKSITGSVVLSQDEFFREEYSDKHEMIPELQHANWESLSSIDWNNLMTKLSELKSHEPPSGNPLIIVEGHLIFNYLPLLQIFDKKYFLILSKEECWERRRVRMYSPPDPPGYFDMCVWPMYLKNKKEIEENVMGIDFTVGYPKYGLSAFQLQEYPDLSVGFGQWWNAHKRSLPFCNCDWNWVQNVKGYRNI